MIIDNTSKYHCVINGIRINEIAENSLDGICNAIVEGDYSQELADTIECLVPSLKEAVCEDFSWDFVEDVQKYIDNAYGGQSVLLQDESDNVVGNFPLQPILSELCENYYADENGCVQAGHIWSAQLQTFINKGEWLIGFRDEEGIIVTDLEASGKPTVSENGETEWMDGAKNYVPILWYGIKGKPISEMWKVENDSFPAIVPIENGMGAYGGQMQIDGFEINYPSLFDDGSVESWYFGCGGNEGANFSKVLNECPIDLHELLERQNGNEQVAEYCLKLQTISLGK